MHELSIAMSIVELAEEEAEKRDAKIEAVHLRLGALSGVVKEALLSCYEMACENTSAQGSRLIVEEVPVIIFCQTCNVQRPLTSIQQFICPECNTPSWQVLQGKELEVVALEITECVPNHA